MWMSQDTKHFIGSIANYEDHAKAFCNGEDSMRVHRLYNSSKWYLISYNNILYLGLGQNEGN